MKVGILMELKISRYFLVVAQKIITKATKSY